MLRPRMRRPRTRRRARSACAGGQTNPGHPSKRNRDSKPFKQVLQTFFVHQTNVSVDDDLGRDDLMRRSRFALPMFLCRLPFAGMSPGPGTLKSCLPSDRRMRTPSLEGHRGYIAHRIPKEVANDHVQPGARRLRAFAAVGRRRRRPAARNFPLARLFGRAGMGDLDPAAPAARSCQLVGESCQLVGEFCTRG